MRAGGLVRPLHGAILRPIVAATALATIIMGAAFGRETKRLPAAGKRWAGQLGKKLSPIEAYVPMRKHPQLFESLLRDEWLADTVRDLVAAARNGTRHLDLVEEAPGVYSFELFTPAFADAFLDEVDAYAESGLPVRRPNSMNNYGLIVNEIGMKQALTELQREILWPVARLLWPTHGSAFHDHHSFMVRYRPDEDAGLDMHTDDSDVTFNVCLGKEFTGAGLTFCGMGGHQDHRQFAFQYKHVKGRAVVHLGTKRHGADDIISGDRRNLIIWNHNNDWRLSGAYRRRMSRYSKESGEPDERCLSYTHDRDYAAYKPYPPGVREKGLAQRAWCPPPRACYDTMSEKLDEPPRDPYGRGGMCPVE